MPASSAAGPVTLPSVVTSAGSVSAAAWRSAAATSTRSAGVDGAGQSAGERRPRHARGGDLGGGGALQSLQGVRQLHEISALHAQRGRPGVRWPPQPATPATATLCERRRGEARVTGGRRRRCFYADSRSTTKIERRVRRDRGRRAALRRRPSSAGMISSRRLPPTLHADDALVPALDDRALAEREVERFFALPRRVEHLAAAVQRADVVDRHRLARPWLRRRCL